MTDLERDCPRRREHCPQPTAYLSWMDWAEAKGKTHRKRRCRGCGLWLIWERKPKRKRTAAPAELEGGCDV